MLRKKRRQKRSHQRKSQRKSQRRTNKVLPLERFDCQTTLGIGVRNQNTYMYNTHRKQKVLTITSRRKKKEKEFHFVFFVPYHYPSSWNSLIFKLSSYMYIKNQNHKIKKLVLFCDTFAQFLRCWMFLVKIQKYGTYYWVLYKPHVYMY